MYTIISSNIIESTYLKMDYRVFFMLIVNTFKLFYKKVLQIA